MRRKWRRAPTSICVISKDVALRQGQARGHACIAMLPPERRREEIARMLAGAEITDEARAAAERLIKAASVKASAMLIPGRRAAGRDR